MTASRAFGEQLDELGIWWPRGDGDALREAARDWTALADVLDDVLAVLDTSASTVADHQLGDAGQAFATLWRSWSGADGHLATTAADCRRLAAALADFGTDVDVADRTLALLIAQIADGLTPERIEWLRTNADDVGAALHGQAAARATSLTTLGDREAPTAPVDVRVLDPDRIRWIDPGTPRDLSFLGSRPVDFGAGQGVLPGGGDRPPGGEPGDDRGLAPNGGITIHIDDSGTTIRIDTPGRPLDSGPDGTDAGPGDAAGPTQGATRLDPGGTPVDPAADEPAPPDPLAAGGGTGGGGGGGSFDASAFDPGSFDPTAFTPELPELPAVDQSIDLAPDVAPDAVPVSISPPGAAVAAGAAVAGVAAAGASGGGGRPPLPFMPMGAGGGGGDDGEEPRRRATARRRR